MQKGSKKAKKDKKRQVIFCREHGGVGDRWWEEIQDGSSRIVHKKAYSYQRFLETEH